MCVTAFTMSTQTEIHSPISSGDPCGLQYFLEAVDELLMIYYLHQ